MLQYLAHIYVYWLYTETEGYTVCCFDPETRRAKGLNNIYPEGEVYNQRISEGEVYNQFILEGKCITNLYPREKCITNLYPEGEVYNQLISRGRSLSV